MYPNHLAGIFFILDKNKNENGTKLYELTLAKAHELINIRDYDTRKVS